MTPHKPEVSRTDLESYRGYAGLPPLVGLHMMSEATTTGLTVAECVARLLRFERAIEAINRARESDYPSGRPYLDGPTDAARRSRAPQQWSDLALACGFYDQSHFINEFRAFSGETPESFRRRSAEAAA